MTMRSINGVTLGIVALVLAPFADHAISLALHAMVPRVANQFLALLCSWPFYGILLITPLFWNNAKRRNAYTQAVITIIIAYLSSVVLKEIFHISRPFIVFDWTPLESFRDYGFPSSHAATVFALLPLVRAYAPRPQLALWWIFALLVAFARISLGMHFMSDVLAGALLGGTIGYAVLNAKRAYTAITTKSGGMEAHRQTIHIFFGLLIVILIRTSVITPTILPIMAVLGGCLALLQRRYELSFVSRLIERLERPSDRSLFPGRGIFFYLLGSWIALLRFPQDIALAAILILAFGDGGASLVGQYFGATKIRYNTHKTWEGTFGGIIMASIAAGYFLPWWIALVASIITMLVETLPLRIGQMRLDDNLILPFVAASVITLVSPLIG